MQQLIPSCVSFLSDASAFLGRRVWQTNTACVYFDTAPWKGRLKRIVFLETKLFSHGGVDGLCGSTSAQLMSSIPHQLTLHII